MATLSEDIDTRIATVHAAIAAEGQCGDLDRVRKLLEELKLLKEMQQLDDEPIEEVTHGYT